MPKLTITGLNPLKLSEKQIVMIMDINDNIVVNNKSGENKIVCDLDPGEYTISIITMVYLLKSNIKLKINKKNTIFKANMQADLNYKSCDDHDYLKSRGWIKNGDEWVSPHKTFSHFDTFLCARFSEFLENHVSCLKNDEKFTELLALRDGDPVIYEKAIWTKYREITNNEYIEYVTSNIIDA